MGRLFWKFFLFIWLAQLAGILGTGALFWAERHRFSAHFPAEGVSPPAAAPPVEFADRMPSEFAPDRPVPPGRRHGGPLPVLPMVAGLLASLLCAAGLAWYFAKPIRHLRQAFDAAAAGDLDVRVTSSMGGRRDELADLGLGFDRMASRLQATIEGQQRLLHDVSHEMRSPLARLQAAIGLARQQPARMEDSLARIEREGERIDQLVGELLTLSRLDAGAIGEPENVEIGEMLANIVADARFEGTARQVSVDFVPGAMLEVRAHPELLHRAIENVVRNALRHSPVGGVVTIDAGRSEGGRFRIAIADQGPGVPEGELEAIFRPFFRSEGQDQGAGYGLGLAIAQRAIAAVNGKIWAKAGSNGGFLVEIELSS